MNLRSRTNISTLFALFISICVCNADKFYLVKTCDMLKNSEYKAMSETDYKKLANTIDKEGAQFTKAHKQAEIEWNKQEGVGRYPGRSLKPRQAVITTQYKTLGEAEQAVTKKNESEVRSTEKKAEREKKSKNQNRGRRGRNSNTKDKSRKRREAKEQEHQAELEQAHGYFIKELNKRLSDTPEKATTKSSGSWF